MEPGRETQTERAAGGGQASGDLPGKAGAGLPGPFRSESLPGSLFGYDRQETAQRLAELESLYRLLRKERDEQVRVLQLELERLRAREQLIGQTLIGAQEMAQEVREAAQEDAREMMRATHEEMRAVRETAEREAAATARELVAKAEREQAAVLEEARRARAFVEDTHDQLAEFLLAAVKWYERVQRVTEGEPDSDAGGLVKEFAEAMERSQLDSAGVDRGTSARIA